VNQGINFANRYGFFLEIYLAMKGHLGNLHCTAKMPLLYLKPSLLAACQPLVSNQSTRKAARWLLNRAVTVFVSPRWEFLTARGLRYNLGVERHSNIQYQQDLLVSCGSHYHYLVSSSLSIATAPYGSALKMPTPAVQALSQTNHTSAPFN
jgi:hypothetical protein